MEQDRVSGGGPDPGMCGCDRDLFLRVWRRVMPEPREDCPIVVDESNENHLALPENPLTNASLAPQNRKEEAPPAAVMCLGPASNTYGEQLQRFIARELTDWRYYRSLAGLAGSRTEKALRQLANEERGHAGRLSAAYFLISGVHFWPERAVRPVIPSLLGALRQRFSAEQQGQADYNTAAANTGDNLLKELYLTLAQEEANHADRIRGILEKIHL